MLPKKVAIFKKFLYLPVQFILHSQKLLWDQSGCQMLLLTQVGRTSESSSFVTKLFSKDHLQFFTVLQLSGTLPWVYKEAAISHNSFGCGGSSIHLTRDAMNDLHCPWDIPKFISRRTAGSTLCHHFIYNDYI